MCVCVCVYLYDLLQSQNAAQGHFKVGYTHKSRFVCGRSEKAFGASQVPSNQLNSSRYNLGKPPPPAQDQAFNFSFIRYNVW